MSSAEETPPKRRRTEVPDDALHPRPTRAEGREQPPVSAWVEGYESAEDGERVVDIESTFDARRALVESDPRNPIRRRYRSGFGFVVQWGARAQGAAEPPAQRTFTKNSSAARQIGERPWCSGQDFCDLCGSRCPAELYLMRCYRRQQPRPRRLEPHLLYISRMCMKSLLNERPKSKWQLLLQEVEQWLREPDWEQRLETVAADCAQHPQRAALVRRALEHVLFPSAPSATASAPVAGPSRERQERSERRRPVALQALRQRLEERGLALLRANGLALAVARAAGLGHSMRKARVAGVASAGDAAARLQAVLGEASDGFEGELSRLLQCLGCGAEVFDGELFDAEGAAVTFPRCVAPPANEGKTNVLRIAVLRGCVVGACAPLLPVQLAALETQIPNFLSPSDAAPAGDSSKVGASSSSVAASESSSSESEPENHGEAEGSASQKASASAVDQSPSVRPAEILERWYVVKRKCEEHWLKATPRPVADTAGAEGTQAARAREEDKNEITSLLTRFRGRDPNTSKATVVPGLVPGVADSDGEGSSSSSSSGSSGSDSSGSDSSASARPPVVLKKDPGGTSRVVASSGEGSKTTAAASPVTGGKAKMKKVLTTLQAAVSHHTGRVEVGSELSPETHIDVAAAEAAVVCGAGDLRDIVAEWNLYSDVRPKALEGVRRELERREESSEHLRAASSISSSLKAGGFEKQDGSTVQQMVGNDCHLAFLAVTHSGLLLRHLSDIVKINPDVVIGAVRQNFDSLQHAPDVLKSDVAFARRVVRADGRALKHVSRALRADEKLVLEAIAQNAEALHFAAYPLGGRRVFLVEAVKRNGLVLEHAPEGYRSEKPFVLSAVSQSGAALEFAATKLREDREIVSAAFRQSKASLRHASIMFQTKAVEKDVQNLRHTGEALQGNEKFVTSLVLKQGSTLKFAAPALQGNVDVVKAAARQDLEALAHMSPELRESEDLCYWAHMEDRKQRRDHQDKLESVLCAAPPPRKHVNIYLFFTAEAGRAGNSRVSDERREADKRKAWLEREKALNSLRQHQASNAMGMTDGEISRREELLRVSNIKHGIGYQQTGQWQRENQVQRKPKLKAKKGGYKKMSKKAKKAMKASRSGLDIL